MDTKFCPKCATTKPISEYYNNRGRADGLSAYCRACQQEDGRISARRIRLELIELLGGKCTECDWSDPRALQVDHVNGGGSQERRNGITTTTRSFVARVLAHHEEYQLLCANHNVIKRFEDGENVGNRIYNRTVPIERKIGIGNGNAPAQRAALARARTPEHQVAAAKSKRGKPAPGVAEARRGTKLVTDPVTGKRHWARP